MEIVASKSAREFSLTSATSKMAARPHLGKGHLALNVWDIKESRRMGSCSLPPQVCSQGISSILWTPYRFLRKGLPGRRCIFLGEMIGLSRNNLGESCYDLGYVQWKALFRTSLLRIFGQAWGDTVVDPK